MRRRRCLNHLSSPKVVQSSKTVIVEPATNIGLPQVVAPVFDMYGHSCLANISGYRLEPVAAQQTIMSKSVTADVSNEDTRQCDPVEHTEPDHAG